MNPKIKVAAFLAFGYSGYACCLWSQTPKAWVAIGLGFLATVLLIACCKLASNSR